MWLVFRYNKKELNLLNNEFKNKIDDSIKFYIPKIKIKRFLKNKLCYTETEILEDYAFCYHESFSCPSKRRIIKNLKGLKHLISNCENSQFEIEKFISFCKKNSSEDGFIKQNFFDFSEIKKGVFLSGPFTNMFFNVIKNQKNKLKILVGEFTTTISKNSNFLYRQL